MTVTYSQDHGPAMSMDHFRKIGHTAVDLIADHLDRIRETPVIRPMTATARRALTEQRWSAEGADPQELLHQFAHDILPYPMGNGHPRFFGWVNSPPAPIGIIAELLAAAQDPSCDVGDIAALHLEGAVIRWFVDLVGLPADAAGLLVSGGSMASLTGLAAARQWVAERDGWDVRADGASPPDGRRLLIYLSGEAHSSIRKSVELLGLGHTSIRLVPTDDTFRLDPARLAEQIRADLAAGHRPFCVVASAGTVNTGAVDPFDALADICAEHDLWLHVDGAYGGAALADPELAEVYTGLSRVDSMTIDAHKWLSVPVECGCALVRDGALLRRTFSLIPPYLHTEEGLGIGGPPSYAEYGFQQTRGFRALKLWMVLQHTGRQGLTRLVRRHLALARELADGIARAPELALRAPVQLSVVCFQYVPTDRALDRDQLNALNRAIEARVQSDGRTFLTSTVLHGDLVLRACVLHYDTTAADVAHLIAVVREIGAQVTGELA